MNFNFKAFLPHLLALGIFLSISVTYFHPALEGYTVKMHDIKTYRGMSKEIADFKAETGEEPLWTNAMFGGMPATQISIVYNNWMSYAYNVVTLGLPRPISILWMYLLGFYILLLSLKVDYRIAIVGAIAFAFSSYFFVIIQAGHMSKANAISLMAPTLAGIILAYRGRVLLGGSLFALFLGLELWANHLQITYYFIFIVVFVALAEFIRELKNKNGIRFIKTSLVLIAFSALSATTDIGNLWGTIEYGKESTRGKSELTNSTGTKTTGLDKDYATAWSYGKEETFSFMFPYVKGGGSLPLFLLHEEAVSETNLEELAGDLPNNVKQSVFNQIANETSYWGNQSFTSGNDYIGIIVVYLALLALFYVEGTLVWGLLGVTILGVMLAWGKNLMWFTDIFMDYIPGYNKFRAVSMSLVIAELAIPVLATLFLRTLVVNKDIVIEKIKTLYIVSGVFIGMLFLFLVIPDSLLSFFSEGQGELSIESLQQAQPDMTPQQQMGTLSFYNNDYYPLLKKVRIFIFKSDVWKSLILILLTGVLIVGFLRDKINLTVLSLGLGLMILGDMWTVNGNYINSKDYDDSRFWEEANAGENPYAVFSGDEFIFENETAEHPEILELIKNKIVKEKNKSEDGLSKREIDNIRFGILNLNTNFRVFAVNSPFSESRTSYFYKSLGGYHGAKMKRYQELIDSCLNKNNQKTLDMLNAKYIVEYQNNDKTRERNNTLVQERKSALGNAWFVNEVRMVENADEEIAALKVENGFNPSDIAIIDKRFNNLLNIKDVSRDDNGTIKLDSYKPNHLVYSSKTSKEQVAVFSEIYYKKGWQAYIDEKAVDHFRTNYVLRGMSIPAGEHKVEFKYSVNSYQVSNILSPIGFVIILGLFFFAIYKEIKDEESIV